jgi:diacylglycerol kinase family enzyme
MNVRLYDGTVRCPDCFDTSTYQCETSDPCTYCTTTQSDEEWLEALSTLVVGTDTRHVQLDKIPCSWCHLPAAWKITDESMITDGEYACTDHGQEWFPALFPQVTVS